MKSSGLLLLCVGVIFGFSFVNANYGQETQEDESQEVILGHRIAPNGQEILVYQH